MQGSYFKMKINTYSILVVIIFYLTISNNPCAAYEKINIQSDIDTAYLPYYSDSYWDLPTNPKNTYPVNNRMMVLSPGIQNINEGEIIIANNVAMNSDGSPRFVPRTFPYQKTGDDDPINYTITACQSLINEKDSNVYIIGVCHNSDSVFAYKHNMNTDATYYKFLYTNNKNLKKLTPLAYVLNVEDYDFDGEREILLYVGNQKHLRRIYQISFNHFELEWELEVSSSFGPNQFTVYKDSTDPKIIFITGNPANGMSDNNYDDSYSYLSIVNSRGEILYNRIIGRYSYEGSQLIFNENDSTFFIKHFDDFIEPNQFDPENLPETYCISKINDKGEVIKKLPIIAKRVYMWMMRYGKSNQLYLFICYKSEKIEVYDVELNLKYVGDTIKPLEYFDRIKIKHESDSVYVFSDGLYDSDLIKILQFPFNTGYFAPVEYDTLGNLTAFAISNADTISIRYIKKKRLLELLSVFYHRNKLFILIFLSSLLVGLVITNIFRHRSKSNLNLISKQKLELEKTYQSLKEAQAIIVAQEKFQQAKDIAGGFAHEIRNSLFPARSALNKMMQIPNDKIADEAWIKKISKFADDSVDRAISLTKLISQYTSLEADKNIEQVDIIQLTNKVLHDNTFIIENNKIQIDIEKSESYSIYGNYKQFYIVINNLILNAVDALKNIDSPKINLQIMQINNKIVVNIRDNGAGIDVHDIDKLFDVFFSTKPSSGSGLGLAIVKKILEIYDSSITVNSELGIGSTFTIHFKKFALKDSSHGKE